VAWGGGEERFFEKAPPLPRGGEERGEKGLVRLCYALFKMVRVLIKGGKREGREGSEEVASIL